MTDPMAFDSSGTLIERCPTCGRLYTLSARRSDRGVADRRLGPRVHTGVYAATLGPTDFDEGGLVGQELTLTEIRMLAAYVEHGTSKGAAQSLGRSVQTVKNHLTAVHVKTGAATTIEALRRLGWLVVPPGALRHG